MHPTYTHLLSLSCHPYPLHIHSLSYHLVSLHLCSMSFYVMCHVILSPLQLTTVHNQMHSKGGYDHSSHVPAEATPSGHSVSLRVVSYDVIN